MIVLYQLWLDLEETVLTGIRLYETLPPQIFIRLAVVYIAICIFILLIHLNFVPRLFAILQNTDSAGESWSFDDTGETIQLSSSRPPYNKALMATVAQHPGTHSRTGGDSQMGL